MASIKSKTLFITTSPRTPSKMIPEITLLNNHFSNQKWNNDTQIAFLELLREEDFFHGKGDRDPAWSARDRITRSPKSLGLVVLSPKINLTLAGEALVNSKRKEEIFLRQLLKFQVPSPYHKPTKQAADFWVKPYLEIFRLVHHLGSLKFDELKIFGLQLVDYQKFDEIVLKIEQFRVAKLQNQGNYKKFRAEYMDAELRRIYSNEIASGNTKTRETNDDSILNFLAKKARTMRDYADACFRYLRMTGMVNVSHVGKSLSIVPQKIEDVEYFLEHTDREPCFIDDKDKYIEYLGNPEIPILFTDNRTSLINKIQTQFPHIHIDNNYSILQLKELLADELQKKKEQILDEQIAAIKDYHSYSEINTTFEEILKKSLYDNPLMLEWNTWRAMTMLNGGHIKTNLKFDDFGKPMSTAQGNMADIVCDYGDFGVTVEVTMQVGQKQYESESEPVSRHLGKVKKETKKPTYCLFIAPKINAACIAHFYGLHKLNINYYGGKSTIVPLSLKVFTKMLENSYHADFIPQPNHIQHFFERSNELANASDNETEWYDAIVKEALNWLSS